MSKERLTAKQQQILKIIKTSILEKGYPPSVREMCTAVGLSSTSSVHAHLEALEKKGYIKKDPSKPRTIEIMDDTFNLNRREIVNVPLLGDVAAGEPIFAAENISNYYPMPVDMLPNAEIFMLNVKGDSMMNVGIYHGDKIIVSKQSTANNGEIVVAMVDDSATVKRFYREKNHFRLKPENDAMEDIIVKDLEIIGKVVGLLRML
ncbi:transcriptional repressor LexA [Bacteroides heparinolyticus]|uniref:transcriptional repressor LexA n=1 Tax=Prevotella heparinolytica TaxID=28113 RepID=UPI0035A183BC